MTTASTRIEEFREDSARLTNVVDHLASSPRAEETLQNIFQTAADGVEQLGLQRFVTNLETKVATLQLNPEQIGITLSNAAASKLKDQILERQKKQSSGTFMFLAMMDELALQIATLDRQIAELDTQIEALDDLIDILDSGEAIDPTDPDHQRLLRLAGIPEDEWGTVTMDDLRKRSDDAKAERDAAKAERDDKAAVYHGIELIEEELARDGTLPASRLNMDEAVEQYAALNPNFDPQRANEQDVINIRAIHTVNARLNDGNYQDADVAWFKTTYAELTLGGLSSDDISVHVAQALIEPLYVRAKDELILDQDIDFVVREMLALNHLNDVLDGAKPNEIDDFIALNLGIMPEPIKQILVQSDQVEETVKQYLRGDENATSPALERSVQ